MFENLKDHYLENELRNIKPSEDTPSIYSEQVESHQQRLDVYNKYEEVIQKIKTNLDEETRSRIAERNRAELLQVEIETMRHHNKLENKYTKEQFDREINYLNSEIGRLKGVIVSIKNSREPTLKEKQLAISNQNHETKIQQLRGIIIEQDLKIHNLAEQKHKNLQEYIKLKQESDILKVRLDSEVSTWKNRFSLIEKENKELASKLRNTNEILQKHYQIAHKTEVTNAKTQQAYQIKIAEIRQEMQKKIDQLQNSNRELNNFKIQQESEGYYKQKMLKRYEEELKQMKEHRRNMTNTLEFTGQLVSERKKKIKEVEDPENNSEENKQKKQKRLNVTHVELDHHCRCEKAIKYRSKLKQANEKIMQLITEKCRYKLQLAHLNKTTHLPDLTLLSMTADLDNMIIL